MSINISFFSYSYPSTFIWLDFLVLGRPCTKFVRFWFQITMITNLVLKSTILETWIAMSEHFSFFIFSLFTKYAFFTLKSTKNTIVFIERLTVLFKLLRSFDLKRYELQCDCTRLMILNIHSHLLTFGIAHRKDSAWGHRHLLVFHQQVGLQNVPSWDHTLKHGK